MSLSSLTRAARGAATAALVLAFGCNSLLDNRPADVGQDFGTSLPTDPGAVASGAERDDDAGAPPLSSSVPRPDAGTEIADAGAGVVGDSAPSAPCAPGFADCNGLPADGCEANLASVTTCGACGVVCLPRPQAAVACIMGVCTMQCLPGRADCNGNPADGCEKNLQTSKQNCGQCGALCLFGDCENGVCQAKNDD